MRITFTIPYPFLRHILAELRRRPYHVAVGSAGLNVLPAGTIEVLAQSCRLVHEGALHRPRERHALGYELGFVPFTLNRPQAWQAMALAARLAGDLPATPTCSIRLGSGQDVGLFAGICAVRDQIVPVQTMQIVGAGMHRVAAVDFRPRPRHALSPDAAERWSRVMGALGGREVWQRLVSLHVCIVGLGRTGSLVATTLVKQGVQTLSLIDPDVLHTHNLDAMDAVTMRDLGRRKAAAIAENLQHAFPFTHITALPQSVMTLEARLLAKSADILVCCVDHDAARLYTGGLACCYAKPLLDIGTGISSGPSSVPPVPSTPPAAVQAASTRRALGADVRLILPGDGCLLCWGGVAQPQAALQQWRTGPPRRPWYVERAGSLRSLNALAAHLGIRLLEDLVAGRLTHSVWLRFENGRTRPGVPSTPSRAPSPHLCALCPPGLRRSVTGPVGRRSAPASFLHPDGEQCARMSDHPVPRTMP